MWEHETQVQLWKMSDLYELYFPKLRLVVSKNGAIRNSTEYDPTQINDSKMLGERTVPIDDNMRVTLGSILMLVDAQEKFEKEIKPAIQELIDSMKSVDDTFSRAVDEHGDLLQKLAD